MRRVEERQKAFSLAEKYRRFSILRRRESYPEPEQTHLKAVWIETNFNVDCIVYTLRGKQSELGSDYSLISRRNARLRSEKTLRKVYLRLHYLSTYLTRCLSIFQDKLADNCVYNRVYLKFQFNYPQLPAWRRTDLSGIIVLYRDLIYSKKIGRLRYFPQPHLLRTKPLLRDFTRRRTFVIHLTTKASKCTSSLGHSVGVPN